MRHPRIVALSALTAVVALLSGCAGVPTSGPIEQGPVLAAPGEDQLIQVIARPPRDGMTPEEVVRGFQEATASNEPGFTVAEQYLTVTAAGGWDPGAGVLVSTTSGLEFDTKDDVVTAQGTLSGTIDEAGQYSVAAPGTPLRASYGVSKVGGEWRISSLPNGLVLTPGDIDRGYRTFNLYYFTRDFSTLVPDPVTIPLSGSGLPTQLVRGLLAGATSWLAPAVRTAFPEGTALALDSVPVRDGIAEVALTDEVLGADDATRQALSAQLVWTLRQLPDVSAVRMTVGGQAVAVPGAGPVQPVDSWATYDPDVLPDTALAYAVEPRGLVSIDVEGSIAVVGRSRPEILRPAVSLDSTRVAGLGPEGASLWEARLGQDQAATRRYIGTDLSAPSWDRLGAIWFVDRGRGLIRVRNGVAAPVPVMGLPKGVRESDLADVAVSRDGTRMALLVRRGTRVEPLVARLENTEDSVRVSAPRRIESVITEAVDLAWQDADTLLVLGRSGASSLEVVALGVGSSRVRRSGAPEGAVAIAAGPGRATLVGTAEDLYRNGGSTWTRLAPGTDPTYPG
jgi:hypothetical protein